MSAFALEYPCLACQSRAQERESGGASTKFYLCESCNLNRQRRVESISRDRSYRMHLSKQIAGLHCDNGCPETTCSRTIFQLESEKENAADELLEKFAFRKFHRPDSHLEISSWELLAAHHDTTKVRYCNSCYKAAIHGANENLQVAICTACLERRDTYVDTVHRDRGSFCLPSESRRPYVPFREATGDYREEYDEWYTGFVLFQIGGGSEAAWIFGAITACYSAAQVWRAWQIKRHNDRMYEQGQANLQNADRTHAMDLAKQWASMTTPEPTFEQVMQKLDEMQAILDARRPAPEPDPGTYKFWEILAGADQVRATVRRVISRSSKKITKAATRSSARIREAASKAARARNPRASDPTNSMV